MSIQSSDLFQSVIVSTVLVDRPEVPLVKTKRSSPEPPTRVSRPRPPDRRSSPLPPDR
jgi:hypothetical protein